ncbi:MAG: hypothetical protein V1929_07185 [bacterium]
MKWDHITEITWGVVLWLFRCFCVVWTVVVVLLAGRAFVTFLQ